MSRTVCGGRNSVSETADQRDPADKRDERRDHVAPDVVADHNGETDREANHADEGDGDGIV